MSTNTVTPVQAGRPAAAHTGYRPEIQGLRAVAVTLVAAYHVWLGRVSGGVDVFLLLSGFFTTGALLRRRQRAGGTGIVAYWARTLRRLTPTSTVVLLAVVVGSLLVDLHSRWVTTLHEIVATALYVENWHLADSAVDYLAAHDAASPVQHFWSLSVQGQFYLTWPLLIAGTALLARWLRRSETRVVLAVLAGLFAASLVYSVVRTSADQAYTYFDTVARIWEFALGGLLVIVLPRLDPPRAVRVALGWLGVAGLVSCGLVLQVSTVFPGYAALWPTLSAVAVIVAGTSGARYGADRLLASRPLRHLGDVSYALYLWHWPLLVFYLAATRRSEVSLKGGVVVLVAAYLLAVATTKYVENRFRYGATPRGSFAFCAACLAVVLAVCGAWSGGITLEKRHLATLAADTADYPGAALMAGSGGSAAATKPGVPVLPGPLTVSDDEPSAFHGCQQTIAGDKARVCAYGPAHASRTIAIVGGSRAGHWLPALQRAAKRESWRLLYITKASCLFSGVPQVNHREPYPACDRWNADAMRVLRRLRPDAVFTTATYVDAHRREYVPAGYEDRWRQLDRMGIPVIAIRDVPRPGFSVPECVERYGAGSDRCDRRRADFYDGRPLAAHFTALPPNVRLIDMTEYLCGPATCPAVIGNVLVYFDDSHFTTTFARTLAPMLRTRVAAALRTLRPAAVVAFGDSITAGAHSTRGHRYPDDLARLLRQRYGARAPRIVDAGQPGERLLWRSGFRPPGLTRFTQDVVNRPGVRVVLFLEGGNDIDGRHDPGTAAAMIAAYRKAVRAAHAHGIRIIGGTITPRGGLRGHTPDRERTRQAVNTAIRRDHIFDDYIDFDAALRDPRNPVRMRRAYASPDHRHPRDAGYAAMARAAIRVIR
ncbi:MAG TPA: SGNH hydrolase domain-containing protein [Streptosporangiaceae bacterium]